MAKKRSDGSSDRVKSVAERAFANGTVLGLVRDFLRRRRSSSGGFEYIPEYHSYIDPAVVTAALPEKFHGSQEAARRYAEGYRWGQENVVKPREEAAPVVGAGMAAAFAAPSLISLGAQAAMNPFARAAFDLFGDIDGARNFFSDNGVQKTVRKAGEGDVWGAVKSGIGDVMDLTGIGGTVRKVSNPIRTARNLAGTDVGKRMAEVVMRQSSSPFRSLREVIGGRRTWRGTGLLNNLEFILTGDRSKMHVGDYNGLIGFSSFDGEMERNGTDLIGAYLYGNTLDPRLGTRVYNPDYGVHAGYVAERYPGRRIPVYEVGETGTGNAGQIWLDDMQVKALMNGSSVGSHDMIPTKSNQTAINAAGHRLVPTTVNGKPGFYQQDIWKFNPDDYMKKWDIDHPSLMHDANSPVQKFLLKTADDVQSYFRRLGVNYIDAAGTPVITRSTPVEFTNPNVFFDYQNGGEIHIKPENRGKFTALKERTGHSASWFKENGTPAQKKMAVFALNARKWNHKDDGGDIDRGRLDSIVNAVNERSDADFVKRLLDTKRGFIRNYDGSVSSHELGYVTAGDDAIVFPEIQNIDSNLVRLPYPQSLESAIERGDTLQMSVPDAELYTANYKEAYPGFEQYSQYGQGFLYPSPSTESGPSVVVDTVDVPVEETVPEYDYDEIKRRQYYIESKFNDTAKSPAGARGAYQIMPITLKDYTMRTGETGDLDDYAFNEKVRDFYMDRYLNSEWATKENQSEYNRIAKALAAYNWGVGNLTKYLNKKKEAGVDIYGGTEWISGLPAETRNYIKWILDNEDIGNKTTNEKYEKAKKKRFSYGGALRRALDSGESELIRAAIEKMRAGR